MSFDKVKAMRNAERFLAQGKIRAAISEYKSIIESDPTDYNTMNMLGDLYVKATEEIEAVNCFTQVAEHYTKQGFSQKAIAIYNKISRLKPDSLEVSSKLAQLYQSKGSIAEAKTHYTTMAEQYSKVGKKAEALMVWKQIANLDPNNTDIYLKIADACWADNQKGEAAQAYIEAGNRLVIKKQFESAITAYSRALEIKPEDMTAIRGFVEAQSNMGFMDDAAATLEKAIEKQPYNRELQYMLIDCYLDLGKIEDAQKLTIRLVEQEPSNYPRLLDLVKFYLKNSNVDSAILPLSMASEHLLVGGQHVMLEGYINEILNKNPDQLDAIRLLVRFHNWQRDEAKIKSSLERLAEAARANNAVDDEKNALSQLIMISPQSSYYAQRLHELNVGQGGFAHSEIPTFESFQNLADEDSVYVNPQNQTSNWESNSLPTYQNGNGNGHKQEFVANQDFKFADETHLENEPIEAGVIVVNEVESDYSNQSFAANSEEFDEYVQTSKAELSEFEKHNLQKEIEGIDFYIAQGFNDLAEKTLNDLETRFGKQTEIDEARKVLKGENPVLPYNQEIKTEPVQTPQLKIETVQKVEEQTFEPFSPKPEINPNLVEFTTVKVDFEQTTSELTNTTGHLLDDIKSEFGIEEKREVMEETQDFDTPYQTGIAYKEMGLLEDSIREFQNAVKITSAEDGTRRFYWCCNMLGHCFIEKGMANLALIWFKRALESKNLTEEELQGLYYEIADAYEKGGDIPKALENFEKIYAYDVSFRDVGERITKLMAK